MLLRCSLPQMDLTTKMQRMDASVNVTWPKEVTGGDAAKRSPTGVMGKKSPSLFLPKAYSLLHRDGKFLHKCFVCLVRR